MISTRELNTLKVIAIKAQGDDWELDSASNTVNGLLSVAEGCTGNTEFNFVEDAQFIATFNPVKVLELLKELETLRSKRND